MADLEFAKALSGTDVGSYSPSWCTLGSAKALSGPNVWALTPIIQWRTVGVLRHCPVTHVCLLVLAQVVDFGFAKALEPTEELFS
eukprot:2281314-Rhodomonas_salina.1